MCRKLMELPDSKWPKRCIWFGYAWLTVPPLLFGMGLFFTGGQLFDYSWDSGETGAFQKLFEFIWLPGFAFHTFCVLLSGLCFLMLLFQKKEERKPKYVWRLLWYAIPVLLPILLFGERWLEFLIGPFRFLWEALS